MTHSNENSAVQKPRTEGFRLGQCHGRIQANKKDSEAHMQRSIFFHGAGEFELTRINRILVRWAGYEMPISKANRGPSIDLIGYDDSFNIYLVELKRGKNLDRLGKVAKQIREYAERFKKIRADVEKEFNQAFFHDIKFKEIRKVILAPRRFFYQHKVEMNALLKKGDIALAHFARLPEKDEQRLIERSSPLRLSLLNRNKVMEEWK